MQILMLILGHRPILKRGNYQARKFGKWNSYLQKLTHSLLQLKKGIQLGVTRIGGLHLHNWDMPDVGSANPPDGNMGMGRRGKLVAFCRFS